MKGRLTLLLSIFTVLEADVSQNVFPTMSTEDMQSSIRKVLEELNRLPVNEIAARFRTRGIHGERFHPEQCPIANYLKTDLSWAETVIVTPFTVSAYPTKDYIKDYNQSSAVSLLDLDNVYNFRLEFDQGMYPELFA